MKTQGSGDQAEPLQPHYLLSVAPCDLSRLVYTCSVPLGLLINLVCLRMGLGLRVGAQSDGD